MIQPHVYNCTPYGEAFDHGLSAINWAHNWGDPEQITNPHYHRVWNGERARAGRPPSQESLARMLDAIDPSLPLVMNGEWGAQAEWESTSWDGRSYDDAADVLRFCWEHTGGSVPMGIYGYPVMRRRSNHSESWAERFRRFSHRPFRYRDRETGRYTQDGLALYMGVCYVSMYLGSRLVSGADWRRSTERYAKRIQRLWQRPMVPFVSAHLTGATDLIPPRQFMYVVEHAFRVSNVNACCMWTHGSLSIDEVRPYYKAAGDAIRRVA